MFTKYNPMQYQNGSINDDKLIINGRPIIDSLGYSKSYFEVSFSRNYRDSLTNYGELFKRAQKENLSYNHSSDSSSSFSQRSESFYDLEKSFR